MHKAGIICQTVASLVLRGCWVDANSRLVGEGGWLLGRKVRVERTIRLRIPALYGPLMVHPRSAAQEYHVKWGKNITIKILNLNCVILLEYE